MTSDQGFWEDAEERAGALAALVAAWERGDPGLPEYIARIDREIIGLLERRRLPRGPIAGIEIIDGLRPWLARKLHDCALLLSGQAMRARVGTSETDDIYRSWIHESLHARRPFVPLYAFEYRAHLGYEEGLVETLVRFVLRETIGREISNQLLDYHAAAWAALALELEVPLDYLARTAWEMDPGAVRTAYVQVIDAVLRGTPHEPLTDRQRGSLKAIADQLFASERARYTPNVEHLRRLWRMALQ